VLDFLLRAGKGSCITFVVVILHLIQGFSEQLQLLLLLGQFDCVALVKLPDFELVLLLNLPLVRLGVAAASLL